MDSVSCVLLVLIIIGIIIVVYSFVKSEKNGNNSYSKDIDLKEYTSQLDDKFDTAIEEFNKITTNFFDEYEEKYQQILFLYELINSKQERISANGFKESENSSTDNKNIEAVNKKNVGFNNPKLEEILALQQKGLSISEISKTLNMGIGETKLIIELGKKR